eukprot:gene28320-34195_t
MEAVSEDNRPVGEGEEEEKPQIDPNTLKPDLYLAASTNDTEKVLQLLDIKVPPTHVDTRTGLTALHWASLNGNVLMTKRLLECGAADPYHAYIARVQKNLRAKEKKKNHVPSSLEPITETSQDLDEAADETKEIKEGDENEHDHEEESDDDGFDMGLGALDIQVDYTRNTPLLYAALRGHLRIIWLLLTYKYSPNDLDKMENNAIHLSAACGDVQCLQVLLSAGGNANAVNFYKNRPLDMSKTKAIREVLVREMERGASRTDEERKRLLEENLKQYTRLSAELRASIEEAKHALSQPSSPPAHLITSLKDLLKRGEDMGLEGEVLQEGAGVLSQVEVLNVLQVALNNLTNQLPLTSTAAYTEHAYPLERAVEQAVGLGVDASKVEEAILALRAVQGGVWVATLLKRL